MKYIRSKRMGFLIFEDDIQHKDLRDELDLEDGDIIGGGFVTGELLVCEGFSGTLGVRATPEDTTDLLALMRDPSKKK